MLLIGGRPPNADDASRYVINGNAQASPHWVRAGAYLLELPAPPHACRSASLGPAPRGPGAPGRGGRSVAPRRRRRPRLGSRVARSSAFCVGGMFAIINTAFAPHARSHFSGTLLDSPRFAPPVRERRTADLLCISLGGAKPPRNEGARTKSRPPHAPLSICAQCSCGHAPTDGRPRPALRRFPLPLREPSAPRVCLWSALAPLTPHGRLCAS